MPSVSWEKKKILVVLTLLVYCVAGLSVRFFTDESSRETYPFFSWYLFADVPNQQYSFTVDIISLDSKTYDPPISWSKVPELFSATNQSPTHYVRLIQDLGASIESGNQDSITASRVQFETIFLNRPATYEVLRVSHNTVLHWESVDYTKESVLKVFTVSAL